MSFKIIEVFHEKGLNETTLRVKNKNLDRIVMELKTKGCWQIFNGTWFECDCAGTEKAVQLPIVKRIYHYFNFLQ